jgi:hypothetical protein
VRWLKFLLLAASCVGAIGFFLPFRYTGTRAESAHDLIGQAEDDWSMCDARETRGLNLPPDECRHTTIGGDGDPMGPAPRHYAYPPFFFLSCVMMAVLAGIAILRRRLDGLLALLSIVAALVAIGGPLREARHHHVLSWGAALLAISGALALAVGIAGMLWREEVRPRPPRPPELPEARVLSR